MLPKKYHAIIFICILVMLLLLGLHLLGIGYSGSQAAAKSAALARNSSQPSSSAASALNAALSQNQAYRHPISYDKLTGATNNQISDVLGAKQAAADYPIDHYQQQQQQQQRQQQPQFATNPLAAQDDFFTNIHRGQAPAGFPPPPPPLGHHPALSHRLQMGPPPLVHQMAMTTQPPMTMPLPPPPPPPTPPNSSSQRSDQLLQPTTSNVGGSSDSLPSASSLTGASGARPPSNSSQQQPAHYTPPIFAYNNFDQQQQQQQPLARPASQFNEPTSFGFAGPLQRLSQSQPPLGLSQEMSPDEYQARQQQARLRQLNQQQLQAANEVSQQAPNSQPQHQSPNLLADPQQQLRHKQQMLDRQLLFGNGQPPMSPFDANLLSLQNQTQHQQHQQHGFAAPDPNLSALYRPGVRQPPYAHSGLSGGQISSAARMGSPTSLGLSNNIKNGRLEDSTGGNQQQQQMKLHHQLQMPERQLVKSLNPTPLMASPQQQGQQPLQQQQQLALSSNSANLSAPQMPVCAAKQRMPNNNGLELANTTVQSVVLFCNEDSEYPTKEIMRALETYATERSIEQLLPQLFIHMDQRATSASLDPLLPVDGTAATSLDGSSNQLRLNQQSMSSNNYEPMCRSASYLAQPRRARNLLGQWKVVVNLPGHKYRGIAVSQMVRVEECLRPNSECNTHSPSSSSSMPSRSTISAPPSVPLLPKSRCLQHYESQRLVAWSHQQGLHLDIFRVPIACSCHIRR